MTAEPGFRTFRRKRTQQAAGKCRGLLLAARALHAAVASVYSGVTEREKERKGEGKQGFRFPLPNRTLIDPQLRSAGCVHSLREGGSDLRSRQLNRPVIVAVVAVRIVQVAVYQVVGMVAVRDGLVAAAGAMLVTFLVTAAIMTWRASRWVGCADRQ